MMMLNRGIIMNSFTVPPTTSLSISSSSLTNSGFMLAPNDSTSTLLSNNNNNINNTRIQQTISSFSGCPNCFVIDNELIYRCDECVRREELQREEQQESVSRGSSSDPLSSPNQTDLPSSSYRPVVEIKAERISDDEQSPMQYQYNSEDQEEEDYRETFHPSKRPRRSTAIYNTSPPSSSFTNTHNNNNNNSNINNIINSNSNSNSNNININTNPLRVKQETTPSPYIHHPIHRRSNVSITYLHNTPSFDEQFQQTVSFARERGFDQMVDFLISSLHKNMNNNNTTTNANTNTNTNTNTVSITQPQTATTNANNKNNNSNNTTANNHLLQAQNAVVGSMTSCPSSPSLPLVAPSSPLYLPSPNSVYPQFLSAPPSELLPGYYIYNKSIDSDTEQKEKVWIQIELPRDQVIDRDGRFLTVSMGMEMGPLPHDPNSFVELESIHLQGTEGTLITETLTKCVYVFDKLRIPNRALISEVLNTEYQGLRAGRFVFKVGDRVLPNRSARFVIKAPSGNRIRSVNSKAKKSKKPNQASHNNNNNSGNTNNNHNNNNHNNTLSTTLSTRRGGNRNYNFHDEDYDSDFQL